MENIIYIINKIRIANDIRNIFKIFIFLLLLLFSTIVNSVQAESIQAYDHSSGNRECYTCHNSTHATAFQPKIDSQNTNPVKTGSQITSVNSLPINQVNIQATTDVLGNITLITSIGQDWYQQGIYGPSADNSVMDGSWGWTFFDEDPQSGFITPNESVTQRNNIYALLLDDGNNSNPISGAQVMANVTYWTYDGTNYVSNNQSVQLIEDINHRGLYIGRFNFYGGTPYSGYGMDWCDGCHKTNYYGGQDINIGYFPGNYTILIKAESGNKIINEDSSFEVTPWGCEDCHGSGNRHRSSQPDRHIVSADMDSACYTCHSVTEVVGMYNAGNPHQNTAHININCMDCHTNRGLDSSFGGVTFNNGGINNAPIPQYSYNTIQLNRGTHLSLLCTDCHKDLVLPNPQGGYKSDNYTINDTINRYNPNFASIKQFQDYYAINVTGEGSFNISFDWDGIANIGFYLYPPNFNPRNFTNLPYAQGSTFTNKPEIYGNTTPATGLWILQIYGYNLNGAGDIWVGELQPPINYTINSTYPIQHKDMPSTPECNSCHNSTALGKAFTNDNIPDWNPGFAHVDTNNDGTPDIQCRMCHNAMHDITIKDCQSCHTTAPTSHPISDPEFNQYTPARCLACHGDPHEVSSAGGTDCIACHAPNDVNISKFARHANINTSDGTNNVTN
ncbi:MAG: hypothetical protein FIB08_09885, partial [Candidatus Methanoperedens sp.]|nr:hypothetical protein [Candidatus Methanoperedens sp.]